MLRREGPDGRFRGELRAVRDRRVDERGVEGAALDDRAPRRRRGPPAAKRGPARRRHERLPEFEVGREACAQALKFAQGKRRDAVAARLRPRPRALLDQVDASARLRERECGARATGTSTDNDRAHAERSAVCRRDSSISILRASPNLDVT
jgi:hypothetical protein